MIDQIKQITNANVLVYGDIMIDKYVYGSVTRISPEAPVPILKETRKRFKLGGAGNVIDNLISLGAKVRTIGYVGKDADGNWAKKKLKEKGIEVDYIKQYSEYSTTTKTRFISKNQQFLRCDKEEIRNAPIEFNYYLKENIDAIFHNINVVIISDYAKGAVTKELAQILIDYANKRNIPSIVDPKGKDFTKYKNATVCTPNVIELETVVGRSLRLDSDIYIAGREVLQKFKIDNLVLTRSEKGITLFNNSENPQTFSAISKDVVDVSGAGDTVVATIACLISSGVLLSDCCRLANLAASVVCSKLGTATVSFNELMGQIVTDRRYKYVTITNAKYIIESLREKGKRIVFTNGCFDMLHAGHLSSFLQARKFGDVLIVAVNSDSSIKRIKGPERPIIEEKHRIEMLCAIEWIDYVVLLEDDNPAKIISYLQPNITVKGKDWQNKPIPEQSIVESYGGEIKFIDLKDALSTTNIIRKIRNE